MSVREHEPMLRPLAMAAERSNRPTAIVAFSALLLIGATLFLLWSSSGVAGARQRLVRAARESGEVERLAAQITQVRQAGASAPAEDAKYARAPNLLSGVSAAADQAGLRTRPRIAPLRSDEQRDGALVRQNVQGSINGEEVGPVLAWIETALRQTPGLYVSQFKAVPNRTTGWNIEVRFSRWELKQ